jgi:iron complex transport system permease protein
MASPVAVPRRLSWRAFGITALGLLAALAAGVALGPVEMSPWSVTRELIDRLPLVTVDSGLTEREAAVLWQLRVPRVVLGGLVGGTLALAGASYQGVFRNPLADPFLLGVAAGAGLGATIGIVFDLNRSLVPLLAFVGALAGVGAAYFLGYSLRTGRSTGALLLAGVAVAAFLTATQTYLQQLNADALREVYTWILGRLTTTGWYEVRLALPYLAVGIAVLVAYRRTLDVLALGDEEATSLGVNVNQVRTIVIAAATLVTASAVAVSGLIAFVGIIVPHILRLVVGTSYRRLIPLSILGGGAFLVLADVMARSVQQPAELPIGVITAFIGAPFFVFVLRTAGRTT